MSRRKKPLLENILIEDIGAEGNAIARLNNMVLFVPMAIPGDLIDVQITRKRKKYMEGKTVKIHKYSEKRVEAFCEHFSVCGGCKWQHLSYSDQLYYKEKQVIDALKRIGKVDLPKHDPIIGADKTRFYRNKLEYTFSNNKWFTKEEINSGEKFSMTNAVGFHLPGRYDKILDINKCWLQEEPGNEIRNFIRKYAEERKLSFYNTKEHKGFLRNLIIRNSSLNELMVILVFGEDDKKESELLLKELNINFPSINSLLYSINLKKNDSLYDQEIICFSGQDHIKERLEDLEFKISPKSFFQTNTEQVLKLYDKVREFAGLTSEETVYDLYTGTGSIAIFLSRYARNIVGIEAVADAIADAEYNAAINKIKNTKFYTGDIKDILNEDFLLKHGRPDVIISDPPRAGMHTDVLESILKTSADKIIYVSCNPATQARDMEILGKSYKVSRIQAIDMFPHTHHVESIVVLERKI